MAGWEQPLQRKGNNWSGNACNLAPVIIIHPAGKLMLALGLVIMYGVGMQQLPYLKAWAWPLYNPQRVGNVLMKKVKSVIEKG